MRKRPTQNTVAEETKENRGYEHTVVDAPLGKKEDAIAEAKRAINVADLQGRAGWPIYGDESSRRLRVDQ